MRCPLAQLHATLISLECCQQCPAILPQRGFSAELCLANLKRLHGLSWLARQMLKDALE